MHDEWSLNNMYSQTSRIQSYLDAYSRCNRLLRLSRHARTARKRKKNQARLEALLKHIEESHGICLQYYSSKDAWWRRQADTSRTADGYYWNPTSYMRMPCSANPYLVGQMPLYV